MNQTERMQAFESFLQQSVQDPRHSRTAAAMEYALMGPGKRVRPRLLFAVLQDYGVDPEKGFPAAAAIEMIHTYSLIHDDLPAMDNDDLRRGRPTCHKAFDEACAILAGDGLLTQAFSEILKSDCSASQKNELVQLLSDYAGVYGMIYGQELDMQADENIQDMAVLQNIEAYKTGCLLTLPMLAACVLADHREDMPVWEQIGKTLGYQFQIQDDILDVEKSALELGKSNSDAANQKLTAVTLMGLDKAKKEVEKCYEEMQQQLEMLHLQNGHCAALLDWLLAREK